MNSERWRLVEDLFQAALKIPLDDRDTFLQEATSGDAALVYEIKSLLTSARRAENFLEEPAIHVAARSMAISEAQQLRDALVGENVSGYRILRILGGGGMGSVWLAERSDGRFERQVAIKFLSRTIVGHGNAERFTREGSIVGRLAHRHIAELIDAGVTARGEAYLILEYVDGRPIDHYCDEHTLNIEARINLFLDVLSAVSHAHTNLIVHRDIKPSNVLVRHDGQVKLLDFGIAKLLADEAQSGAPTLTIENGGVLTPRFAAPEQVTQGAITTATDVYALGVLFYLLLTGQHPAGSAAQSPAQLAKSIVEDETPPPSEAIIGKNSSVAAGHRATTPDRLRRQLRGDLDTIVGKALKKDPPERYVTVSALADDLRRYLIHEPISARPDTFAYRGARFLRRNRTAVGLVSLVVVATVAGAVGTLVQARSARAERDFALRQLSRAEAINELNSMVLSQNQSPEMIDRTERILAQQQDASLADRVEVLITLGRNADMSKDGGARSRHLLEKAYQLSRGLPEPSTRAKAACALAGNVSYGANVARSEALVQEGLNGVPQQPEFALDRVFCLEIGSAVSRAKGDAGEAISRLMLARELLRQAPIPSWRLEFLTSLDLANALRLEGRLREASTTFEHASARLTAEGRGDTGAAASLYYSWGVSLLQIGRPLEAEKVIHRAIVIESGGENAPAALPWQLISHARALRELGRLDEAAVQTESAYARSLQNGDQTRVNQALLLRASIYRMSGDLAHAQETLGELERRLRTSAPPGTIAFSMLLSEQALTARARGDMSTALDLTNRALAVAEGAVKTGQRGADLVPILLTDRSGIELQLGRSDQAAVDANEALKQIQQAAGPDTFSSLAGRAYSALGGALHAQGRNDEARATFRLAADHLDKSLGPDHPETRVAKELAPR